MPYPLQRRYKSDTRLTPEEEDVLQALGTLYTDDPDKAAMDDFTPTLVLYRAYLRHVNQYDYRPGDPDVLTLSQFGAALRRVFAELGDHPDFRCQRTVNGERVCGYLGILGPGTIRVHTRPGRTKVRPRVD